MEKENKTNDKISEIQRQVTTYFCRLVEESGLNNLEVFDLTYALTINLIAGVSVDMGLKPSETLKKVGEGFVKTSESDETAGLDALVEANKIISGN